MPRGAEYSNGAPQSDNPIEVGENKAHGASGQVRLFLSTSILVFPADH